jgi:hypothetical protein
MTPKQKAEELVAKFYPMMDMSNGEQVKKALAKHSAIMTVDIILDALDQGNLLYTFYLKVKEELGAQSK